MVKTAKFLLLYFNFQLTIGYSKNFSYKIIYFNIYIYINILIVYKFISRKLFTWTKAANLKLMVLNFTCPLSNQCMFKILLNKILNKNYNICNRYITYINRYIRYTFVIPFFFYRIPLHYCCCIQYLTFWRNKITYFNWPLSLKRWIHIFIYNFSIFWWSNFIINPFNNTIIY